ncbi:MAG: GMC family oxidoreductase [Caldilineaceae bacterium]|nr:GMC family oxidoreductase [Caldilineaceae bacterium]
MRTEYGVGADWPIGYDDLERYYAEVEEVMAVSGPSEDSPFPRSTPYPQPPHNLTDPDKLFKTSFPDGFYHSPCARARVSTANRPRCCANGVCVLCPINSKFTIQNELAYLYEDPRVTVEFEAEAKTIDTEAGLATGVTYANGDKELHAEADLIVLGANAIFNPHILQRSQIDHPLLGKYLDEQTSIKVIVLFDGLDNYQGSTSITGHGYMLYDGPHRRDYAACLMETSNVPWVRSERGKWQQRLHLQFIYENLPNAANYVVPDTENPELPETIYTETSDYARKALAKLPEELPKLLANFPVEDVQIDKWERRAEPHICGTTVMGDDPKTSVIDRYLVHHQVRNLLVLGSGAFPTMSPANPTLTLSALSLWAADHLVG